MGIVIRQSFWASIFSYLGVLIGLVNTIVLMPRFMLPEQIGLFRTVLSASLFLLPFATLGIQSSIIRFHGKFEDNNRSDFFGYCAILISIGTGIVTIILIFFQDFFFEFFKDKSPAVNQYLRLVILLLIQIVAFVYIEAVIKAKLNISIINFLNSVLYKVLHMGSILAFGFDLISFEHYLYLHLIYYSIINLAAGYMLIKKYSFKITIPSHFKPFNQLVFPFNLYALIGGFGMAMIIQIDQLMISKYLGLKENAIYTIAVFVVILIEMPKNIISNISTPLLAEYFNKKDLTNVGKMYKQASINLTLIGVAIYSILILNIDSFYTWMPNGEIYRGGVIVVFILGATRVLDMAFSFNSELIGMSNYYRFNIIAGMVLGILTVISNYVLIPIYGLMGAAIATCLTFLIFNLTKFIFIRVTYQLNPFSVNTIKVLFIGIICGLVAFFVPVYPNVYLSVFLRTSAFLIPFAILVYFTSPSQDVKNILQKVYSIIFK